jgi:hypothetical protein
MLSVKRVPSLVAQAHSSAPPGGPTETVVDGQLLLLRGNSKSLGG